MSTPRKSKQRRKWVPKYLFCSKDKKNGLWMLAKTRDSYSKFMKEDYQDEAKYLSKLSDSEKVWLNTFLQAYYHQNKNAMDRLDFPIELRRERYNQHRGVKRDIFLKNSQNDFAVSKVSSLTEFEGEGDSMIKWIENCALDKEGFLAGGHGC